jgi:predicted N-acetyltransferase YhbS
MNDAQRATSVRAAGDADAAAIARLLAMLGHPLEPARVVAQLRALEAQRGSATLVAESDGAVVGLVSAQALVVLHRPDPVGRVTALVVHDERIGGGVGTLLLEAAHAFLRAQGCTRIEVTSAPHRTGAHAFYLRRGYTRQGERFVLEPIAGSG